MKWRIKTLGGLVSLGLAMGIASADGNKAFKVPQEPYKIKTEHHKHEDIVCERKAKKGEGLVFNICCEGMGEFACFREEAVDAMVELKKVEYWESLNEPISMTEPRGSLPSYKISKEVFLAMGPQDRPIYLHKLVMNRLADIEKHIERSDYDDMMELLIGISLEDIHRKIEENKSYPDTREWLKEKVCK
jgi:hypothetical protein